MVYNEIKLLFDISIGSENDLWGFDSISVSQIDSSFGISWQVLMLPSVQGIPEAFYAFLKLTVSYSPQVNFISPIKIGTLNPQDVMVTITGKCTSFPFLISKAIIFFLHPLQFASLDRMLLLQT